MIRMPNPDHPKWPLCDAAKDTIGSAVPEK